MSRFVSSSPSDPDPVGWFVRLERAVRERDFLIATEAKRNLRSLGWLVNHSPGRPNSSHEATPGREVERARSHSNGDATTLVGERFKLADSIPPLALRPRPAAKALGISERLLWQLTHDGMIPCMRVGSGKRKTILYSLSALEGWLARQAEGGERGQA
jgi:hypothetical protein